MNSKLDELRAEASQCEKCELSKGRTNVVFGMGDPKARLMFVGEGPGAEEDKQGLPFVGRSGKYMDKLIYEELGRERDSFYIANVVKCRPPGNRDPLPEEIESCSPYLNSQIELINPKVMVLLGNFSSKLMLNTNEGITKMRGKTYQVDGRVLVPTFHPAALLRDPGKVFAFRSDLVRARMILEGLAEPSVVQS